MAAAPAPTVSVVIPTYDRADYVEEALASVYAQTFTDYEIVVVDDGSTDETPQRLLRHGGKITLIRQENRGIGAARNRGLEAARGRYIALLDNDDLWAPEKLAIQVDFMRSHPEAVGCSVPYVLTEPPGKPGFDIGIRSPTGIVDDALRKFCEGELFVLSSAMMIDAAKAGGLRYETEKDSIEDIALEIRLLLRGPYGIAGDRPLATYRVHPENASRSAAHLRRGIARLRVIQSEEGFHPATRREERMIDALISALARKMLVAQVAVGAMRAAFEGYLAEMPHQLRNRRFKFLLFFPFLLLVPARVLRRRPVFRARP